MRIALAKIVGSGVTYISYDTESYQVPIRQSESKQLRDFASTYDMPSTMDDVALLQLAKDGLKII